MSANFSTLFERSRFSVRGRQFDLDENAQRQRMEQQERFATAMIAFAFECDPIFREHFLSKICSNGDVLPNDGWTVLVEPANWGDLVLKNEPRFFIVVELKIWAGLKNHQKPEADVFWGVNGEREQKLGYGCAIRGKSSGYSSIRYFTLENQPSWKKVHPKGKSLLCVPKIWRDLLRPESQPETRIEAAVYDCLGKFGVPAFAYRKLTNMKNVKLGTNATKVFELLKGVLEMHGGKYNKRFFDGDSDYIGLDIPKDQFGYIGKLVDPETEIAGWFGFEHKENQEPRLAFWFYCGRSNGSKTKSTVRLKEVLRESGFDDERIQVEPETNNLLVYCLASESTGDLEWFDKVFKAVKGRVE